MEKCYAFSEVTEIWIFPKFPTGIKFCQLKERSRMKAGKAEEKGGGSSLWVGLTVMTENEKTSLRRNWCVLLYNVPLYHLSNIL